MIRKAVITDIPTILEIEKSQFADPWDEQLFYEVIDSPHKYFFVWIEKDKVTGYLVFEKVADEGNITDLAVAKPDQKKGIATALVSKALETARDLKCKDIILEVRHGNEAAKKLYKKFGFIEAGRRKAYYSKAKEDALIYKLAVK